MNSVRRAMKLRMVVTATVLLGSAAGLGMTASAAAATGTTGAATPSAASEPSISIRAIDREGKQVAVTASLQSPVVSPTGIDDTLTNSGATRVPKGTYNIAAWVQEPGSGAQTLVDRELVVTKSETVVFDARKGRPVRFTVNDPTATVQAVEAEPYSPQGWEAFDGYGAPVPGPTYIVPGKMAPGYILFLEAELTRPTTNVSPVDYVLIRQLGGTIPASLTFSDNKAKLANDHVTVRSIDPGGFDGVFFQAQPADTFGILPSGAATQQGTTPFSVNFHFTPGYEWQSSTLSGTDNTNNLPVFGEHSYSQTFNNAVFGPSPQFGPMVNGNEVEPSTLPWGDYLLDDPTQGLAGSFGLQPASSQAWLYRGSKLLAHSRNGGFAAKISATPAWYTMKVSDAAAGTGAGLFTSETLSYNFRAWAGDSNLSVTNFWPLITPSGLNWLNAAKQGTKTTVRVYFKDLESDSDPASNMTAHSVKVWASANGGKTWTAVRVTESGPHWSAVVTNPAKAGHVSLRVQGTDSSGFTASVTVSNAYAVS